MSLYVGPTRHPEALDASGPLAHTSIAYRAEYERLGYCPWDAMDAADECRHGFLPNRGKQCPSGCHGAVVVQLPTYRQLPLTEAA